MMAVHNGANEAYFKFTCFKKASDYKEDEWMITCIEKCIFKFYRWLYRSDMLYKKNKGSEHDANAKATEKIKNLFTSFKVGLVMWAILVGRNNQRVVQAPHLEESIV